MKATLTTCGASFRNAQLQDLPKQVEDALATIATEEATEFNNFALCYIGALQEAGQVIITSSFDRPCPAKRLQFSRLTLIAMHACCMHLRRATLVTCLTRLSSSLADRLVLSRLVFHRMTQSSDQI